MFNVSVLLLDDALLKCVVTEVVLLLFSHWHDREWRSQSVAQGGGEGGAGSAPLYVRHWQTAVTCCFCYLLPSTYMQNIFELILLFILIIQGISNTTTNIDQFRTINRLKW